MLPISVPEPTEDDITNTPHMAGANVVDLCIQKLNSWNPKNNNGFLRRVACVVSEFVCVNYYYQTKLIIAAIIT